MTTTKYQSRCPLYVEGQIDQCKLNLEGCPVFGQNRQCIAYHEVETQMRLLKEVYLLEHKKVGELELRI